MPSLLDVINKIEPSPLYRAARESVAISRLGSGPSNLNRCQEWGAPRVPVITVSGGGDYGARELKEGELNTKKEWTAETLVKMEAGSLKRVRLDLEEASHLGPHSARLSKRRRMLAEDKDKDLDLVVTGPSTQPEEQIGPNLAP